MTSPADEMVSTPVALRENRDFQIVLAGQAVSALGDAISLTAIPLLVLALTGSGAMMGIVGALQLLPDLVLGLPAGALADRWDRRRMMFWADAGRAVLTAAIPLAHWLDLPTFAILLIVTVPINALRVLSDAGFSSALPGLVGREQLAKASGYLEATLSVPFVIGPALAGLLVAGIGAAPTIAIDALSFACSALSLVLVRRTLRAERTGALPKIGADISAGLALVVRHQGLRTIILYWSLLTMATAALIPALGYYITRERPHGPEIFGLVGSAWSIGYLLGSLLAGRLRPERMAAGLLLSGAGVGLCLVAMAAASWVPGYLAAGFGVGVALAVQTVSYMTLRPLLTPDAFLGRVGSASRTLSAALRPLGQLGGGAAIEVASGRAALAGMGALAILVSLLFGLLPAMRAAGRQPE